MYHQRHSYALTAVLLVASGLALTAGQTCAGGEPAPKDRIGQLQKKRLEALMSARDYLVKRFLAGSGGLGVETAVWTPGYTTQLLDAHKLVFQARFDMAATDVQRRKAIEDSIKDFEPVLGRYEKLYKDDIVDATPFYGLAQAHGLELEIALEKAKRGNMKGPGQALP
jgi:hypothetical protein